MQIQLKGNSYHLAHPPVLAAAVCAVSLLAMSGTVLLRATGLVPLDPTAPYTSAGAFLLLYSVGTSARLLTVPGPWQHARQSLMFFMVALLLLGAMAFLFTGLKLSEAKGYRPTFLTLAIGEFILLAMGLFVRGVIVWLEQEER